VAIGGGHGLAATLQAVRRYAGEITAIVSVGDDGGSSGRLREAFGIPAPGDLRRCLVALGDPESVWASVYEHRFAAGELEGHPVGNLLLTGLLEVTGDLTEALDEAGRLVGAVGRVLPATTVPVVLKAAAAGGDVEGQVAISDQGRISALSIVPPDPEPPLAALAALAAADQIILGPGSLFTSVLAAAIVPRIREAIAASPARLVYVCNLRPQVPETSGYDVAGHCEALMAHGIEPDVVLYDPAALAVGVLPVEGVAADLAVANGLAHDPAKLAAALAELVG
jgi:uncharacterized cofD-like protein